MRRLLLHASFYVTPLLLVLVAETFSPGLLTRPVGWAFTILAILLVSSAFAVYGSIRADRHFAESTLGLFFQAAGLIWFFALLFAESGLIQDHLLVSVPFRTALYFSMVTWTTLGYGDFQPPEALRLLAASEALLGYVYLGLIVGLLGKAFR